MQAVVVRRSVRLASPRERVWPLFADTRQLNRFIGMGPLAITPADGDDGARFLMTSEASGFALTYRELPYEWVENQSFRFCRLMQGGLLRELAVRYDLEASPGGGTLLSFEIRATPRYALIRLLARLVVGWNARAVVRYARAVDDVIAGRRETLLPPAPVDAQELARVERELAAGVRPELARQITQTLRLADDTRVAALRPYELAEAWKLGRNEVLRACLAAVKVGALELRWGILCPSCNQPTEELPSLAELEQNAHCHTCDLGFGVELDRSVEALFSPHPALRAVEPRPYCVAGPALTPHVVAQGLPDASGVVRLATPPGAGRYRVFVRGGATAIVDVGAGGPATARCEERPDGLWPRQLMVQPAGNVEVALAPGRVRHVKLERTDFSFYAATAHHVSLLPEFRAQFGGQALRPGLALRVAQVAVLFSDLCGSTALYSRVGDAAAFGVVTDCLGYGRSAVEAEDGLVVKTMGDAVMAVFLRAEDALAAGARMITGFRAFQAEHPLAVELAIKVGVFHGPCTVVSANGTIDYFGQTVNSAARVQHLAGPGEVVLPADLGTAIAAPAGTRYAQAFEARVKGIDAALRLSRMVVQGDRHGHGEPSS